MFVYEQKIIRATGTFYQNHARRTGEGVFRGTTLCNGPVDIRAYVSADIGQTLLEGAKVSVDIRMTIQQTPDVYREYTKVVKVVKF